MRVFIYVQEHAFLLSQHIFNGWVIRTMRGGMQRFLYAVSVGLSLLGTEKTTLLLALLLAGCADTVLFVR